MLITLKGDVQTANVERIIFLGRDYLKVPVIAFVEGVATPGNVGEPELGLMSEFQKSLNQWNGRPVTLNHPMKTTNDGMVGVSANNPDIYDNYSFGLLFGAMIDEDKLKINAYIDIERAKQLSGDAEAMITKLESGEVNEVSTGFDAATECKKGTFKDNNFTGIWRSIVPDHLAFLVDVPGACSIEDGCGAGRTNSAGTVEPSPIVSAAQPPKTVQNGDQLPKPTLVQVKNGNNPTIHTDCACNDKLNCRCTKHTSNTVDNAKLVVTLKGLSSDTLAQLRKGGIILATEGMADGDRRSAIYAALDSSSRSEYIIIGVYAKSFVAQSWYDGSCMEFPYSEDATGNITIDFDAGAAVRPMTQYVPITTDAAAAPATTPSEKQNKESTIMETPKALSFEEACEHMTPDAKAIALQGKAVLDAKRKELTAKILAAPGNKFTDAQLNSFAIDQVENIAAIIPVVVPAAPAAPITNATPAAPAAPVAPVVAAAAPKVDYRANAGQVVVDKDGNVTGYLGIRVQSEKPEDQIPQPKTLDQTVREKRGLKAVA